MKWKMSTKWNAHSPIKTSTHCYVTIILNVLNVFNAVTLKQVFGKLEYRFLAESTTIENALFPYKTALSKTNVKTNRMGSKKWTYHKEHSFPTN